VKFTLETGLALPLEATKYPIRVFNPECLTSSHAGFSLPFSLIVRSHRPSMAEANNFTTGKLCAFEGKNPKKKKIHDSMEVRKISEK
jgi:hypothetical protein